MDVKRLNDWLQVIGMFGLIASIIFVGLEMRQTQKIALSAVYQARADSSMALRMTTLESEPLLSARTKRRLGQESELTPEEVTAERSQRIAQLVYLENVHYQYISGFLSEEHWQTNRAELKDLLRVSEQWRTRATEDCSVFRESLCAEMRQIIAELEGELR